MFYLGHNNMVPYLSLVFEVLCMYSSLALWNQGRYQIFIRGFLLKCKNHFILQTDQSKSPKNDKNIELELLKFEQK